MDSRNPLAKNTLNGAAAAFSAVLFYFGTGLHPLWPLAWLAPIPIFYVAVRGTATNSAIVAFLAPFLGGLTMWHYLHGVIEIPAPIVILLLAIPTLVFSLLVLAWRRLLLFGRSWAAALSFPVLWTAFEFLNATSSPHSTFGNLAYTQMNVLPVIQIASLTGIWGISFLLYFFSSTVGVLVSNVGSSEARLKLATAAAACLVTVLGFGAWRLHAAMPTTGFAHVRLLSTAVAHDIFPHKDSDALGMAARYSAELTQASDPNKPVSLPDIVILPEKIARLTPEASDKMRALFSEAAAHHRVNTLVGLDEVQNGQRRNDALLFAPDGSLAADYEKHHFIPVLEDGYVTGKDYNVFNQPSGLWGIAICKDMDFPELGRENGKRGVGLLLVPAWDFTIDDWLHSRMAILRGVESGFTLARSAKQGRLSITDNRGRVLAETVDSTTGFAVLDSIAPVTCETTFYVRYGNWFAWLCLAGSAFIVACLFAGKRGA